MRSGPTLSDAECEALYQSACGLYAEGKASGRFRTDVCEGSVSTRGKPVQIGVLSGIEFEAELDLERGSTKARFVVHVNDLARGPLAKLRWWSLTGHWTYGEEVDDSAVN